MVFPAIAGIFFLLIFFSIVIYCVSQDADDASCLGCHNHGLNFDKKFLHPLVKERKCRFCHNSYDESTHKEAAAPVLDVCMECHTQDKLGRSHPVGQGIIDPNTNNDMTCVSTCHLMHGSEYKYQLPVKNNMELCLGCHKEF